jgi:short-subunit dehydrogenase
MHNNQSYNHLLSSIKGKVIIITGASSGIGKEVAFQLAPLQPKLVLIGRRERNLMNVARILRRQKINLLPIVADVRNSDDRKKIVDLTLKVFGSIDILINNAGLGKANLFLEQPEEEINEQIETNLISTIKLTKLVLPIMKEQGKGHVINMSSTLAFLPPYPFAVYNATKAAVKTFSDSLREEVKKYGVTISTVLPGPYNTDFHNVANVGRGEYKLYDVHKLVKKIVDLLIYPKNDLIQPRIFVLLLAISRIFPSISRLISRKVGDTILEAKMKTAVELEKEEESQKREKIQVISLESKV